MPHNDALVFAVVVLVGAVVIMAVGVVRVLRRSRYTLAQAALLALSRFFTRILWRTRIEGTWDIPPNQGVMIVSNHRCPFDPAIIAMAVDRVMRWMVAKEYCESPFSGPFLRPFGVVPTSRAGHDTAATKMMIRYAEQGEIVGLFPEGRINDTDEFMLPAHVGAAMIALRARVPVVPFYIEGSPYNGTVLGCLLMRAHVRFVIGRPIDLAPWYGREHEREVLEELIKRFVREIARLAGREDFEPRISGGTAGTNRSSRRQSDTPPRQSGDGSG
jgi:1-acyl-sn-glycerol-3-phosphate acyltransferase